ncbi:MAG TPA: HD domain-containing protein [Acidimicrobiales bacterium]|nr:HD domain-containing protein [Acidimicrobiales bacterium]
MADDELVARAAAYAKEVHAGDVRKGTGLPYFDGHLAPVAAIVAADGGSPVQVAAAYLHDAAEDHGGERRLAHIRERFGAEVADIVADLSDSLVDTTAGVAKAPWRERKEAYLDALRTKPEASLVVAAADKLHNATSIVDDHRELGDELWSRFTTGRAEDQRWYYEALTEVLVDRLPDHPTVRRLVEAVRRLADTADR